MQILSKIDETAVYTGGQGNEKVQFYTYLFLCCGSCLVHSEELAPHTNDPQRSVSVLFFDFFGSIKSSNK